MALTLYFFAFSTIETLLYAFHLSMLVLLITKRNSLFKGSFYIMFRIVIAADVANFLLLVITRKIPEFNIFVDLYKNEIFATIIYNGLVFVTPIQFFGHTLMALNRCSLVFLPLKQHQIWKYPWYILFIVGLPAIYVCTRVNEPAAFIFTKDIASINLKNQSAIDIHYMVTTVSYIGTTCITALLNVLSFAKFYFNNKSASSINVNERSLLFVSLVGFIAQLIRTTFNLNKVFFPTNQGFAVFFNAALPYFNIIFALSGSISLLILSKTTRKAYKILYGLKKEIHVHTIAPSTNTKFVSTNGWSQQQLGQNS